MATNTWSHPIATSLPMHFLRTLFPLLHAFLTGMSHNNANTFIVYRFVTRTVHSLIVALPLYRSGCIIYDFRANLTLSSGETKNGF